MTKSDGSSGPLHLFAASGCPAGRGLEAALRRDLPGLRIKKYIEISMLIERLRRPGLGDGLIVIIAADRRTLDNVVSFGSFLLGRRVILILPDHDPATVAKGHSIGPRFISYADGDFGDVTAVVGKMIGRYVAGPGPRAGSTGLGIGAN